jgi:hypothetical protein
MLNIFTDFLFSSFYTLKIKKHFKKIFAKDFSEFNKNNNKILLELNSMHSSSIAYAYFCNYLSRRYAANIHAYRIAYNFFLLDQLIFFLRRIFSIGFFSIYKSFGVNYFFFINLNSLQKIESLNLFKKINKKIKDKYDFENIKIDDVLLGDLIYDSYLKDHKKPTIEIGSKKLEDYLQRSIKIYIFWRDYLRDNKIKALVVSHTVYLNAIPVRIAIKNKIDTFQVTAHSIYRLSKSDLFAYKDFNRYKTIFKQFKNFKKKQFIEKAKKRLNLRFHGHVGVDMPYSTKSAFEKKYPFRVIKKSNRIKILVASHCFFDSPHSYGNNLFPDFYEWLKFLGKLSLQTNYDWYIKTHPDYNPLTLKVIRKFIKNFNKFNLLPSNISHHQIIKEGIDFGLTIYGTIAVEYAVLGVCVINGSNNNPHNMYKFNKNPTNIKDYKKLIMNLYKDKFKINMNEPYEYYYMHNLHFKKSWLFFNYKKFEKEMGSYMNQFTYRVYKYYLENFGFKKYNKINYELEKFINSKEYSSLIHYNKYN